MFIENATTGSQVVTISQGNRRKRRHRKWQDGGSVSGWCRFWRGSSRCNGVSRSRHHRYAGGSPCCGQHQQAAQTSRSRSGDDITFADSSKAIFGAGSDLQLYHDGGTSFIDDVGTGNLHIRTDGASIKLRTSANADMIVAENGGAAKLYHAGSQKLATLSTGIDVTGTAVTDGVTVAGNLSCRRRHNQAGW